VTPDDLRREADVAHRLLDQLRRVVLGQEMVLREAVLALVARGHVLFEGAPGTAKTLLVRTLSEAMGLDFRRIQFTPDLMPSDITGVNLLTGPGGFTFRPGPLFASVVLVDEVNRAGPKTQSALLEAMEERQVSAEREVFRLPEEFIVVATQNPREFEGTYPLPESQLDRFMLRIDVDYPVRDAEAEVLRRYGARFDATGQLPAQVVPIDPVLLQAARAAAAAMHVSEALSAYVLDLASASRGDPRVALGLSTRGALALLRAARVAAGLRGADFVTPDEVKEVAPWIVPHRLQLTPEAALEGVTDVDIVRSLLERTPVPR